MISFLLANLQLSQSPWWLLFQLARKGNMHRTPPGQLQVKPGSDPGHFCSLFICWNSVTEPELTLKQVSPCSPRLVGEKGGLFWKKIKIGFDKQPEIVYLPHWTIPKIPSGHWSLRVMQLDCPSATDDQIQLFLLGCAEQFMGGFTKDCICM